MERYMFFDPVETSPGVYDREYTAEEFVRYFATLIDTGLMFGVDNNLEVTCSGSDLISLIDTGKMFIDGRYYENTSSYGLEHDAESLGLDRIDRVVIRLDLRAASRFVKALIKKGTAAGSPSAPSLQRDSEIYELSLAQVYITGGQSYIEATDITDERGDTMLCPYAASAILPSYNSADFEAHLIDYTLQIPYAGETINSGNAYSISTPAISSLTAGMAVAVKINANSTGASTLNWNGTGAKSIKNVGGNNVTNLKAGGIYTLRYDGSNFITQGEGASGDALASDLLSGKTATTDAGEIIGTLSLTGDAIAGDVLNGKTFYKDDARTKITGTMVDRGIVNITPSTINQTIAAGKHSGSGVVYGDADLIAGNIKSGINIFGVAGSLVPLTIEKKWASGTPGISTDGYFSVTGLSFTPKLVVVVGGATNYDDYFTVFMDDSWAPRGFGLKVVISTSSPDTSKTFDWYSDGFRVYLDIYNAGYTKWYAFE